MGRKEILVELTMQVVKVAVVSLTIRDLKKVTLKLKIWFKTESLCLLFSIKFLFFNQMIALLKL